MIRCASAEMSSRSQDRPRSARPSISAISTFGSITTPLPITGVQPGVSTHEGSRCSAYFWPSGVITVCPALLPPWYRTTYPTCPPSRSVTLPLPSSPHWAPISTIAGISITPGCQVTRLLQPGMEPACARWYCSRSPTAAAAHRTVPDLPPVGVLPLYGANVFDLPADPGEVAKAVLHGTLARLDLLRTDAGSVTLDGALIGGTAPWSARIECDDAVLAEPGETIAACAVGNGAGYATVDGLPLVPRADPADGALDVAVAVPVRTRRWGRTRVTVEVRRARG